MICSKKPFRVASYLLVLLLMTAPAALARDCWEAECGPEPSADDCADPDDPFCSGGGSDYPQTCHYCEQVETGAKCSQAPEGVTGQTDCTGWWWKADPITCQTSGSYCENITVTR